MRIVTIAVALLAAIVSASARAPESKQAASSSPRATYAALPLSERMSVQSDLIWGAHHDGVADGDITERDIAAIRAFQKENKSRQTGVLNPQEREFLSAAAKKERDSMGWRVIEDARSGIRVGIPGKIFSQSDRSKSGSRWTSVHGEAVIETFRVKEAGITLAAVFDQQKKEPAERRVETSQLRPDSFFLSGLQGLKRFYMRAYLKGNEVRALTVLYDQAMDGMMEPLLRPIWSAFVPFATADIAAMPKDTSASGKVEYGTGIVASAAGYIVTPRHVIEGCDVVVVPGLGNAAPVATDQANDIALLRVYGDRQLVPLPLGGDAASGRDFTLVGITDPQAQSGGGAVSTIRGRLSAGPGPRSVDPVPASGFSGAAVIDADNRFTGMVQVKPQLLAGAEPSRLLPPATVIPADVIRSFLEAHAVHPVSGRISAADAKASMVRVVCVRK